MEGEALNNGREKEKGGKAKKAKHKGKEGIGRALVSVFVLDCKTKEQKKKKNNGWWGKQKQTVV